jgi:hypothetical protein
MPIMANEAKSKSKPDPIELADHFMNLNVEDFRMFWAVIAMEWNQEDGDIEAQWFYCGKQMRPLEVTVISALYGAVMSGQKAGKDKP